MPRQRKTRPRAFAVVPRRDSEHGHIYETPHGEMFGATTFIGVIDKPLIKFWYASQQSAFVAEAAADLFEDAPMIDGKKMSKASFTASLKKRISGVKAAHKAMEKAQNIGTEAHALAEWTLRRELKQEPGARPKASQEAEWAFQSWENWRRSVELEPLYVEQVVFSKKHGYAGTVDLVAYLNLKDERIDYGRVLSIIDWKTGKRHYAESSLQSAAYGWALHEMGHAPKYAPGVIVRLPKVKDDPGFDVKVVHSADMAGHLAAFINAKKLWEWLQKEEAALEAKKIAPAKTDPGPVADVGEQVCPF